MSLRLARTATMTTAADGMNSICRKSMLGRRQPVGCCDGWLQLLATSLATNRTAAA